MVTAPEEKLLQEYLKRRQGEGMSPPSGRDSEFIEPIPDDMGGWRDPRLDLFPKNSEEQWPQYVIQTGPDGKQQAYRKEQYTPMPDNPALMIYMSPRTRYVPIGMDEIPDGAEVTYNDKEFSQDLVEEPDKSKAPAGLNTGSEYYRDPESGKIYKVDREVVGMLTSSPPKPIYGEVTGVSVVEPKDLEGVKVSDLSKAPDEVKTAISNMQQGIQPRPQAPGYFNGREFAEGEKEKTPPAKDGPLELQIGPYIPGISPPATLEKKPVIVGEPQVEVQLYGADFPPKVKEQLAATMRQYGGESVSPNGGGGEKDGVYLA